MLCRRDILRSCARKMSDLFLLQIRLRSCMNFFGFNLQLLQNFLRSCRTFCALSGFSSYGMDFGLFFAASHFLVRIRICSEVRIRISKTFFSCSSDTEAGHEHESRTGVEAEAKAIALGCSAVASRGRAGRRRAKYTARPSTSCTRSRRRQGLRGLTRAN